MISCIYQSLKKHPPTTILSKVELLTALRRTLKLHLKKRNYFFPLPPPPFFVPPPPIPSPSPPSPSSPSPSLFFIF
jgi:hypothetical protein